MDTPINALHQPETRTIRVAIVDDEPAARARLCACVGAQPDVELVGDHPSGSDLLRSVAETRPDLLFIAVDRCGVTGFDVVDRIRGRVPLTPFFVFVAAHDASAARAFDAGAADYLLEPIDAQRLSRTLERVRTRVPRDRHSGAAAAVLPPAALTRVAVRRGDTVTIVRMTSVTWIEAAANYVRLHADGQSHLFRASMCGVEQRLDPRQFVRVHRSVIVNVDRIVELRAVGRDSIIVLTDGSRLPLSSTFRPRLESVIEGL